MSIAAVPSYLSKGDAEFYLHAPPGHRFLLYLPIWGENGEANDKADWRLQDRVKKFKKQKGQLVRDDDWTDLENKQHACMLAAGRTPPDYEETPRARKPSPDQGLKPWRPLMEALRNRQTLIADVFGREALLRVQAQAVAPFTTGLGNEHPLENGFAFLNPYGLPYLPGSGVKGVLRQAARELARGEWGDSKGWSTNKVYPLMLGEGDKRKPVIDDRTKQPVNLSLLDVLFGLESKDGDKVHLRGTLSFWDVFPQIAGDSLLVDVMTPHQSHYYQWKKDRQGNPIPVAPHDSGQPNPIYFLTVPPGSGFAFHVACDTQRLRHLAPELLEPESAGKPPRWQALLRAAFEHAFEWLGFGAKTAVGYGAMESAATRESREQAARARAAEIADKARQEEEKRREQDAQPWPGARVKFNRANGALQVEKDGKTAFALKPKGEELLNTLPASIKQKVLTNQFVRVTAYVSGGTLVRLEANPQ